MNPESAASRWGLEMLSRYSTRIRASLPPDRGSNRAGEGKETGGRDRDGMVNLDHSRFTHLLIRQPERGL
nr:hypothetical protein StreXyl84_79030 [Streptomyces sp. Xyl84]